MTTEGTDDLLVEAIALLEFYAWNRRHELTPRDRGRVREAVRVLHRQRMVDGHCPPDVVAPDHPLVPLKSE